MRRSTPRSHPLAAGILLTAIATASCARNPVTGDLQLALISESQEVQMGQEAARDVERSIGLVQDQALQDYVRELGRRLAARSERLNLPWDFGVVDDPTPNAFALPGGFVYVTRGMMGLMGTEAQLASVLGHEIGHVSTRHHVTALSRAQLAQIGLGVGSILFPQAQVLGNLAGAGLQLLFLQHGRDAERQADDVGFRYALDEGFDVREMATVFASLQRLGEKEEQSPLPSWLMTHPAPADRVAAVLGRLESIPPAATPRRIGAQPYLEQIDGLVYGTDPRHGFFNDGQFLHPELRFQFSIPSSWERQNLTQAVIGRSPEHDAALQLTIAKERSIDAAAHAFLSQSDVQSGVASRQMIDGLPVVLASFRAQTQQQIVQGLVGFIAYEGRVYQILGYSPAEIYGRHDATFRRIIGSFSRLTDPQALNVQPDRIEIVRTHETMSLAEFNQRFPSSMPVAELAILNQVEGPESAIPAGARVKRITSD